MFKSREIHFFFFCTVYKPFKVGVMIRVAGATLHSLGSVLIASQVLYYR